AVEKVLSVAAWFSGEKDCEVEVRTRTVGTVDDVVVEGEEEFGGESRVRKVSCLEVTVKLRYKIIAKLGFGGNSTAWLCRDFKENRLLTLKIFVAGEDVTDELAISERIKAIKEVHTGKHQLRVVLDHFQIRGTSGHHQCLVYQPLGMAYTDFHISPNNIHVGGEDSAFEEIEQAEASMPRDLKVLTDRTVYCSYIVPVTFGPTVIADFGEARFGEEGQKYSGDVMAGLYRAPEIIIGNDWDSKIDIWSAAVMMDSLTTSTTLRRWSLLGPPPKAFLDSSDKCRQYWDSQGNWIAPTPIPDQSLESRVTRLEGTDKERLIAFVRKMLRWLPEERAGAEELHHDEYLVDLFVMPLDRAQEGSTSTTSCEASTGVSGDREHCCGVGGW
ncbi:protein kinase, partial [Colletotrichum musicola]